MSKDLFITADKTIHRLLKNKKTVAIAESCTGGLLGATLTDVSGSSSVFKGGIIAYDNFVKTNILHLSNEMLTQVGVVSSECALEMALSVKSLLNVSIGVAITGIAGPTGETARKPVGLVFIATVSDDNEIVNEYRFEGNRTEVRSQSVQAALEQLIDITS